MEQQTNPDDWLKAAAKMRQAGIHTLGHLLETANHLGQEPSEVVSSYF